MATWVKITQGSKVEYYDLEKIVSCVHDTKRREIKVFFVNQTDFIIGSTDAYATVLAYLKKTGASL